MSRIKKIASYFWDIPIETASSKMNPYLEVVWSQGRMMLNTKEANFSFGSGYYVFKDGLRQLSDEINSANSILVLGFGCGSILDLLEKEYNYGNKLVGVEYDSEIVRLFNSYFENKYLLKANLVTGDAFKFIEETTSNFDLTCIDLFKELTNVEEQFQEKFIRPLSEKSKNLIFNLTKQTTDDKKNISSLVILLSRYYSEVKTIQVQEINTIVIAKNVILS